MISIRIRGGLGNQLFQYATAYSIARELNEDLGLEIMSYQTRQWPRYELEKLKIQPDAIINPKLGKSMLDKAIFNKIKSHLSIGIGTNRFKETGEVTSFHSEVCNVKRNTYLNGFFQNEKYFLKYREQLLKQFRPNFNLEVESKKWIGKVGEDESVAIHVRRGDYVKIGCGIDMAYYDAAIQIIATKIRNPHFYVFSDEIKFCEEYFSKYSDYQFDYINDIPDSENKDINEFFVMSACKNQIIANSSFSWWGAWLNNNERKKVVAPVVGMWTKEFYPSDWKTIEIKDR